MPRGTKSNAPDVGTSSSDRLNGGGRARRSVASASVAHPARGLATAGALALVTAILASGRVRCLSAAVFGVSCPSCGSTRAMWALARGDFAEVLHTNPVAPFVVVLLVALGVRLVVLEATSGHANALGDPPVGRGILYALLVAFGAELAVWLLRFVGAFGGPLIVGIVGIVGVGVGGAG